MGLLAHRCLECVPKVPKEGVSDTDRARWRTWKMKGALGTRTDSGAKAREKVRWHGTVSQGAGTCPTEHPVTNVTQFVLFFKKSWQEGWT